VVQAVAVDASGNQSSFSDSRFIGESVEEAARSIAVHPDRLVFSDALQSAPLVPEVDFEFRGPTPLAGLGNGISLLIMAGIVARMPTVFLQLITQTSFSTVTTAEKPISMGKIVFLIFAFVFVVAGSILITQAQRRIPIQQAKHTRGRRIYGGQKQYLPLRVNHGGVMPIIFAQSLMLFPGVALGWLAGLKSGR